ncbi:hypothetical protein JXE04_01105 [Patescibacteria group bacterium]|nr:hypothetical protein [Patescibacteria group bacterium]
MKTKFPMYYFCEKASPKFISFSDYAKLSPEEKSAYRPATFKDVRLHGSEDLKKEIKPIRQASFRHSLLFGALR